MNEESCQSNNDGCKIAVDVHEMRKDVKNLERIMNGNGKPGVVAQIWDNDKRIKAVENYIAELHKKGWDLGTILFRGFISVIVIYIAMKVGANVEVTVTP